MDIQTLRDWIIVVYGVIGIITFIVMIAVTTAIGFAVTGLVKTVRGLMDNKISPAIDSVRHTSESVKGGATFIMDTAAAPVIRTYSFFSGVRRSMEVLTGLRHRRRQ